MRQIVLSVVLLCAPVAPASADVDVIEAAPIAACVSAADGDAVALRACRGAIAQPCLDSDGGYTTYGMVMCYSTEAEAWASVINDALERLAAAESDLAPSLETAQNAWRAYRDAECNYRVNRWGEGSGARVALASCIADLSAERGIALTLHEREGN